MKKTNQNLKELTKTTVGVAALGNPHCEEPAQINVGADDSVRPHFREPALNKCRGDFNRPFFEGILKESNGITLVLLVITIVIMLILAGVAISIAIDPNGLFGQAENATEKWNAKVEEEENEMDKILGYLGIDPPIEITDQMPEGKGWNSGEEKPVDKVVVQRERMAPVPKGYTVSQIPGENSIQSGMVIYQIPEGAEVDWENSKIKLTPTSTEEILQETVNQFVWIPVDDINDMVMCKSNGTAGTSSATTCVLAYNTTTGHITCNTHGYTTSTALTDENIDTTGLAGRLYGTDSETTDTEAPYVYTTNMAFTQASKDAHKFSTSEIYREPDLVTKYDNSNYQLVLKESTTQVLTSANALKHQLNNKFIEMARSVAKYGGFYVSRYEAGANGASLKNQKVLVAGTNTASGYNPDTFINGNMWYGMYNTLMSSTTVDKTAVNSHMIWGCQYDMIIKFLSENSKNEPQIGHITRQLNIQKLTGETTTDIMSNIYDLEGNNREWTVQAGNTYGRLSRGGGFNFVAGSNVLGPVSHRYDSN